MKRIYLYTVYERIWHWTQAIAIIALLVSGLQIHFPSLAWPLGFGKLISVHTVAGFLLTGNALLGLFYHVATSKIRQFIPEPADFVSVSARQVRYYMRGIFAGEEQPFHPSPARKLNPLQQITYLMVLNIGVPLQVITGVLLWGAQHWPHAVSTFGGLGTIAITHTVSAWFFAAFLIAHIYLTTTGPTPAAHLKAMVIGWETAAGSHNEESHDPNKRAAAGVNA